jgi:hypothetical protein
MPEAQTQLQAKDAESQVLDMVEAESEFCRQRSGQDAIWSRHHASVEVISYQWDSALELGRCGWTYASS